MTDPTSKVFISYSRKDKVFVKKLNKHLDDAGVGAWVDWEGIPLTADWMAEISRAIEGSDAFLFVISPNSLASKICNDELELALQYNKKLVPIMYKEPPKGTGVHARVGATNWIYLRKEDDFKATLPRLVDAIHTDLEWVQQHTRLLQRAQEWDRKKRSNSFLLRGEDLDEGERWLTESTVKPNRTVLPLQAEYVSTSRLISVRNQRRVSIGIFSALVVSLALGVLALAQRNLAVEQEARAVANEKARATQQAIAEANEKLAQENEKLAKRNETEAKAQRSAAEAQIYKTQAGLLNISTLLALDSWQRSPSFQAEDILRHNISLLPPPLAQARQADRVWNIMWSPDGQSFVTASSDDSACIWDLATGAQQLCVQHNDALYDAMFSPDGRYLITGGEDGNLRIWSAADGTSIKQFDLGTTIWDLDVSADGLWIAAGRDDSIVSVISLANLEARPLNLNYTDQIFTLNFSPDSQWLASGTSNGKVHLWRVNTGFSLLGPEHNGEIYAVRFSSDSNWVVSAGSDSTARVAKTESGGQRYALKHGDWVEDAAFSPDGSWFVTASDDNQLGVWDTRTGAEKLRLLHDGFVQKVDVSPDGQWIASTSHDRTARIWDAVSGSQMLQVPLEGSGTALAFSPEGTRLVVGDNLGNIRILDISSLESRIHYREFPELVHEARFDPSGNWLFANSDDRRLWMFEAGRLTEGHTTESGKAILQSRDLTYNLAVSPNSEWVAVAEANQYRSILYNTQTERSVTLDHGAYVYDIAFDPSNLWFASAGNDGLVSVWELATDARVFELENPSGAASLAFHPDGGSLAVGGQNTITLWDTETWEPVGELKQQSGLINELAFNRQGTWLASTSGDGTIFLWKAESLPIAGPAHRLRLDGEALSLAFSPDGRWLASGSTKDFVQVWDVETGQELARLPHGDQVSSVTFSEDSLSLVSVSRKVIHFWDLAALTLVHTPELVDAACSRLTSNIPPETWAIYLYNEDYYSICQDLP
jgi:WD40 repeat protein